MDYNLVIKIRKSEFKKTWDQYLPFDFLLSMLLAILILRISTLEGINNTISFLLFTSFSFLYLGIKIKAKKWRKWVLKDGLILTMGVLFFGILYADLLVSQAHAQFLNGAETFVKNSLCNALTQTGVGGAGAGSAVTGEADMIGMTGLFFTVIRAVMILYIVISIMKVFNAAREDEDWKTLARTPLIVVIALVIGDSLIALVTGGGAGTTINATGGEADLCGS